MLRELRGIRSPGSKEDIMFFLQSVIGKQSLTVEDIRVICLHAPGQYQLSTDALIYYCQMLGWIRYNESVAVNDEVKEFFGSDILLNSKLVRLTVQHLFEIGAFTAGMFTYDIGRMAYQFKNECFPLVYSSIRNVLVSQGLFDIERKSQRTYFYVNQEYEIDIAPYCRIHKKTLTIDQLRQRLEENVEVGEIAERYVLNMRRNVLQSKGAHQKSA